MTIMPISCTFTIITALSMAGVPPFNGFLSKEMFLTAMFDSHQADVFGLSTLGYLLPIVAIVGSIFTFVYSFKYVHEIFFETSNLKHYLRNHTKHRYLCYCRQVF